MIEYIKQTLNKLINMKPTVILTNLIAVTAALRIPSQHSTQSIVVLDTEDIEVACSIFCIGLTKCCPSGFCVALWESC
ncbi:hypothetical protein CGMCC3_g8809 [Colletotrichum fructicola]|uniref:Uncharacterized protein n=1 Tax=Colletotrichum fructicola (strain Nara gc5) TaxID=1213859 RepID=A0A7J6IM74_COLFN|nr:uncharacterized protein CGMCC3_g8809 [Colletotrichum fructicola]KAE9575452.1 hypothetical protein CGMCC3_g8809 [Colletotrichum fructicola]KAF4413959.1 hypothetical protein CFRS1_v008449 [Colletotrichum fructicola]KAF4477823.1 hypothetical protein CGGC5_v013612 [Colletotrichum fructicola Nara gc5]KAF5493682.1 hypothetical protein CGCF413_v009888 [Colletotrichum fructicola]